MWFEPFLVDHAAAIQSSIMVGTLLLAAIWELVAPLRSQVASKAVRWANHLTLAVLNATLVRVSFPLAAVGLAAYAAEHGIGLFNAFPVNRPVEFAASLLALDLAVYLFHRLFHAVPALWRLHRLHHADLDVDVSTGLRFHPVQVALIVLLKITIILALGAPPVAVLAFEVASQAITLFNHANVRIPPRIDGVLRSIFVTPDMHRIHHSIDVVETNSNFGFVLPWWDRLFRTYRSDPAAGQEGLTAGVGTFRAPRDAWLDRLILNPVLDDCSAPSPQPCDNAARAATAPPGRSPLLYIKAEADLNATPERERPARSSTRSRRRRHSSSLVESRGCQVVLIGRGERRDWPHLTSSSPDNADRRRESQPGDHCGHGDVGPWRA
jgi:sterol desaturase/sphingolipid hydroxylase (fatty acid hydroxylase superfamily)